ncbi:MAG: HipA domain-containing protein [Spirochaetaceae bacterium]|jgi:serine/threonine-protein kinase HipA|nr:HipA domain-containing protein [Spirochaetaceae bacterium]
MICLSCGTPLKTGQQDYHPSCCKWLFQSKEPPEFPFALDELDHLAGQIIKKHSAAVTGVQKKLSLHISQHEQVKKLTFVGLWGNWILKPPVPAYHQLPENEQLSLNLADALGISTVPHGLIRLASGELAYITRRVDRRGKEKIPMEDMCQLSQSMTEQKYRGSLEQVGKLVFRYCQNPLFDVLRFYELVLFCFLTGNGDMHLKNFSLIGSPGQISLAPAYDLLNTRLLIPEREDPEESALAINGKRRKLKLQDFHSLGINLGLTKKQLDNVEKRFVQKKQDLHQRVQWSFLDESSKTDYCELVEQRWKRL